MIYMFSSLFSYLYLPFPRTVPTVPCVPKFLFVIEMTYIEVTKAPRLIKSEKRF